MQAYMTHPVKIKQKNQILYSQHSANCCRWSNIVQFYGELHSRAKWMRELILFALTKTVISVNQRRKSEACTGKTYHHLALNVMPLFKKLHLHPPQVRTFQTHQIKKKCAASQQWSRPCLGDFCFQQHRLGEEYAVRFQLTENLHTDSVWSLLLSYILHMFMYDIFFF